VAFLLAYIFEYCHCNLPRKLGALRLPVFKFT
jgi:hypothetical protein